MATSWYCWVTIALIWLNAGTAFAQENADITFELTQASVTANEPVYVELSIRNGLAEEIRFRPGPYSDSFFDLSVTGPDGRTVRADTTAQGGLRHVGEISVPAGGRDKRRLLVTRWYQFMTPGNYSLEFVPSGEVRRASGETIAVAPQDLRLTVEAPDPARLREVCERLAKAAAGYSDYGPLREAADTLSFVRDPVAIPYLAQVLGYHNFVSDVAVEGLVRIGGPEALEVLKSNEANPDANLRVRIRQGIQELEAGAPAQKKD